MAAEPHFTSHYRCYDGRKFPLILVFHDRLVATRVSLTYSSFNVALTFLIANQQYRCQRTVWMNFSLSED